MPNWLHIQHQRNPLPNRGGNSTNVDAVFQTPDSATAAAPTHSELEPEKPESDGDLGASPILEGPTTRSGRKRKNPAPVKSSGKKKNKMTMHSPKKPNASRRHSEGQHPPTSAPGRPSLPTVWLASRLQWEEWNLDWQERWTLLRGLSVRTSR